MCYPFLSMLLDFKTFITIYNHIIQYLTSIQCVPLATEPGVSLIILPLMRTLQRNLKQTTGTFLFISHTMKLLLFKFRSNILIGVRIIKEMPGSVASGTNCIIHSYS